MSIAKLKATIDRLDSYGAPADSSSVMIDDRDCTYEMLDEESGEVLTLADLRAIVKDLDNG